MPFKARVCVVSLHLSSRQSVYKHREKHLTQSDFSKELKVFCKKGGENIGTKIFREPFLLKKIRKKKKKRIFGLHPSKTVKLWLKEWVFLHKEMFWNKDFSKRTLERNKDGQRLK